jgi:hypothetical protein
MMIKRLTVGLAIAAFAMVLGNTASAATERPAPAEWSVIHNSAKTLDDGCDMTHGCDAPGPNSWEW